MAKIIRKKHLLSSTLTYSRWYGMWRRVTYHDNYKGRVFVCRRWESFDNFLEDMGWCPSENHTLDRYPDNNGDYEPTNCRWATWAEQKWNTRDYDMAEKPDENKPFFWRGLWRSETKRKQ